VPCVSGYKCQIFELGHRNEQNSFEKHCLPSRIPCVEVNTQALEINLCKVVCGSADPGSPPSKGQERPLLLRSRPDTHMQLTASVHQSLLHVALGKKSPTLSSGSKSLL